MIDARTAALLQAVVRRESRSLLQYVGDSLPWITAQERQTPVPLQKLIDEEHRAAADLGRFLMRHRIIPPPLGAYPMEYTNINYVSLDHLLPLLVESQRQAVARLERDVSTVAGAEARAQMEKILAMKRRHLQALEALAAAHPERTAAQPEAAVN